MQYTATDPNNYECIFLGYRATQDNIRYRDLHNQKECHANHMAKYEVQYGAAPENCSLASKHLIIIITSILHTERCTYILLDKTATKKYQIPSMDPSILALNRNIMMSEDSRLMPYITPTLLLMDITTNIHEPVISATIPLQSGHATLGLVPEQHSEYISTVTPTGCGPGTIGHKKIH
jgi:hypothetical protein